MNFINMICPPMPYYIVGGEHIYRPGDAHERRTLRNVFDFIYVRSGTLYMEQEPFREEIRAGQFFIVAPDTPHRGDRVCTEQTSIVWIHFCAPGRCWLSEAFVSDCVTRRATPKYYYSPQLFTLSIPRTGIIPESERPRLEKYLQRMNLVSFSRYTQKKTFPVSMASPFDLQAAFIELLHTLYAPCCGREKENIERTAWEFLNSHYAEDISLNSLARQYSYSASHLIRCFNQAYGMSPMQYLKKLRIEKAKGLLLDSDETIQTIGERVGIHSPSYFISQFRKETGMTPAQYRALRGGGENEPYQNKPDTASALFGSVPTSKTLGEMQETDD